MLKGSILQKLADARQASKTPLNFGVYYKNTLIALCHALEDCILTSTSSPLVITAFQRGKWYLQEADRYRDIAEASSQVVIMAAADTGFAEHPTSQLPNVALVDLAPTDPVAQEWHLIILSPTYTAMVLCQELSPADYGDRGVPKEDLERKFYGFWTFEADLVQEVVDLAIATIATYNPQLAAKLTEQAQRIADTQAERPDALDAIVCRIVDYLHTSHLDLDRLTALPHQQALDRNLISNELQAFFRMAQLIDLADINNPMAGAEVASLAEAMGQLLDLPAWQIKRLRLAGLLHRFGSLPGSESFLAPEMSMHYQEEAPCSPLTCPLIPATQVLRTMSQMQAVAKIITHESEWWNGTGSPAGLKADEIPLESRILGLAIAFQQRLAQLEAADSSRLEHLSRALAECQQAASDRFDPKLIDTLALLVAGMQQGLTLSAIAPKLTSSIWLLDPEEGKRAEWGEGEAGEQLATSK
jgi:DICT domain-containing protein